MGSACRSVELTNSYCRRYSGEGRLPRDHAAAQTHFDETAQLQGQPPACLVQRQLSVHGCTKERILLEGRKDALPVGHERAVEEYAQLHAQVTNMRGDHIAAKKKKKSDDASDHHRHHLRLPSPCCDKHPKTNHRYSQPARSRPPMRGGK
jgi:hypothetical protein